MTNANAESSKTLEIVCLNCNVNENEIKVINGGRKDFSIFEVEKEAKPHIIQTKNGKKVRFEVNAEGKKTKKWSPEDAITVSKRINITVTHNPKAEHDIA